MLPENGATMLHTLPQSLVSSTPKVTIDFLTGSTFFPNAISSPFMTALREAFIIGIIMCVLTAVCSALRGGKYVYERQELTEKA
jgi:hypothetical protein